MNAKKLDWLLLKVSDREELEHFITSHDAKVNNYMIELCYKNKFMRFEEFNSIMSPIFNSSKYRTIEEQIKLANKSLSLTSGSFFKYNREKLSKIVDIVTNENILTNYTFEEQIKLIEQTSGMTEKIYNPDLEYKRLIIRGKIAQANDLNIDEKISLMSMVSELYDFESLKYADYMLDIEYSELKDKAFGLKKFILENIINETEKINSPLSYQKISLPKIGTDNNVLLFEELIKAKSISQMEEAIDVVNVIISNKTNKCFDIYEVKKLTSKLMETKSNSKFKKMVYVLKNPCFIQKREIDKKEIILDRLLCEKNEEKLNTMCEAAVSENLMDRRNFEEQLEIIERVPPVKTMLDAVDFSCFVLSSKVLNNRTTEEIIKLMEPLNDSKNRSSASLMYRIVSNNDVLKYRDTTEQIELMKLVLNIEDEEKLDFLFDTKVFTNVENISFQEQVDLILEMCKADNNVKIKTIFKGTNFLRRKQ